MICNNLTEKIAYTSQKLENYNSNNNDLIEELMLEYCETKCDLEYCRNYRLKTKKEFQTTNHC